MSELDSRVRKVTWALLGVAVGGLIGSLLLGVVVVAQIRGTQVDNTRRAQNDAETLTIIKDCTQPEGECTKRNQRNLAKSIAAIDTNAKRTAALAAACAAQVPNSTDPQAIYDCMQSYLKAGTPKP